MAYLPAIKRLLLVDNSFGRAQHIINVFRTLPLWLLVCLEVRLALGRQLSSADHCSDPVPPCPGDVLALREKVMGVNLISRHRPVPRRQDSRMFRSRRS